MAETTTTTTEDPNTTTTTTEDQKTTTTTTVEKQGEVVVDKGAEARTLGEQEADAHSQRLEDARNEALQNHAAEHADDEPTDEAKA